MKHLRTAIAGILALFAASAAIAQTFPTVPGRSVIGRLGVAGDSGPSSAIPMTTLAAQLGISADIVYVTQAPYNAACNGSTDDTAAIQAAINATPITGRTIAIPSGRTCVIASTITLSAKPNLSFIGYGGFSGGGSTPAIIHCTGIVTRCIDARDSSAVTIAGMTIFATSAGFTGILVDAGSTIPGATVSSAFRFDNATIGLLASTNGTCLNLSSATVFQVSYTNFARCAPAIQGQTILGQSTVGTIRNNHFTLHTGPAVKECGESWTIEGNAFEQDVVNNANAFLNSAALPCLALVLKNNWFGDVGSGGASTWVTLTSNGAVIEGNRFGGNASATAIALSGGNGYEISGNYFIAFSVGLSCASSPSGGYLKANNLSSVATAVSGTCVRFVDREGNTPSISSATASQLLIGQSSADAAWTSITGDVTVSAAGVTAIGTAKVTMAMLATMATNTVNGNATSGSASPTALAMPSCSTAASALKWTTNTGFGCNTAIDAANATNSAITNDTTTNATMFPVWVTANTGNLPVKVSSTKLTFNPSTARLGTTGILAAQGNLEFGTIGTGVGGIYSDGSTLAIRSFSGNLLYFQDSTAASAANFDSTNFIFRTFGSLATQNPVTKTGTSGSQGNASTLIMNPSGTYTLTLNTCNATFQGQWLSIKSIAAQTINSASSNVQPRNSATAGTAILASGAGNWATLQCDSASGNWIIMAGS